jgi:hypothetical protein
LIVPPLIGGRIANETESSFNPKPEAMAGATCGPSNPLPAIAYGFGLNLIVRQQNREVVLWAISRLYSNGSKINKPVCGKRRFVGHGVNYNIQYNPNYKCRLLAIGSYGWETDGPHHWANVATEGGCDVASRHNQNLGRRTDAGGHGCGRGASTEYLDTGGH